MPEAFPRIAADVSPDAGRARDTGALDPGTLTFANPLDSGLVANRVVTPEAEESGLCSRCRQVLGEMAA